MGTAVGPRGPVAGISSRVAKCRLTAGVVVVGGAGRGGSSASGCVMNKTRSLAEKEDEREQERVSLRETR